jgi:hypothetical protein
MEDRPLGWIAPEDRTDAQQKAHEVSLAKRVTFALPYKSVPVGTKVLLTDSWKDPKVVKDTGTTFTGFRQLTGACLIQDEKVRMLDGSEKSIQDIKEGEYVITHKGRGRKVTGVMSRQFNGNLITIKASGYSLPLTITEDHQVAVRDGDDEILWKYAEDLKVDDQIFIGWFRGENGVQVLDTLPLLGEEGIELNELMKDNAFTKGNTPKVPNSNIGTARYHIRKSGIDWKDKVKVWRSRGVKVVPRYIKINEDFARWIGLYLAEGSINEGRITFTFNITEKETLAREVVNLTKKIFDIDAVLWLPQNKPTTCTVRISNVTLSTIIKKLIPGNIYTKRVPGLLMHNSENIRKATFLGWMAGDGHTKATIGKGVTIVGISVCSGLAKDMTILALSCGLRTSLSTRVAYKHSKQAYAVSLRGKAAVKSFAKTSFYADTYEANPENCFSQYGYCKEIKEIVTTPTSCKVYDIEVEEDHSFIAEGIVVHNCVGASAGNAIFTLAAMQRLLATNPTAAFIPFWPFAYGRTRANEGDRGQGEGAVDSVMGQTLVKEGVLDATTSGLPTYDTSDGFCLTSSIEMQWSDGNSSTVTKWESTAKVHPLGSAATLNSPQEIQTAIINGYPVLDGCSYYVGNGSIKGSGSNAYVTGHYDGRGGHSTCFLGFWSHPSDGPLYLYSNQWPTNTYSVDPAGGGRCCVWLPESEVEKLFRYGGSDGETMALSHLTAFPSQSESVIDWSTI